MSASKEHLRLVHSSEYVHYLAVVKPEEEKHYFLRFLQGVLDERARMVFDEIGTLGNIEDVLRWEDVEKEAISRRIHLVCYRTSPSEEINLNDINLMPGGFLIKIPDELTYAVGACNKDEPSSAYVQRTNGPIIETVARANRTDMEEVLYYDLGIRTLIDKGIISPGNQFKTIAAVEVPSYNYILTMGIGEGRS